MVKSGVLAILISGLLMVNSVPDMKSILQNFDADNGSLERFYVVETSSERINRLEKFYNDNLAKLDGVTFKSLDQSDQVDYILFKNHLHRNLDDLKSFRVQVKDSERFIPYLKELTALCQDERRRSPVDPEAVGALLAKIEASLPELHKSIEAEKSPDLFSAYRAARFNDQLLWRLDGWFKFYNQYDPIFTWWVAEPYKKASAALKEHSKYLRETICHLKPGDSNPILGDPIGREALLDQLKYEFIPYSPEELIEIGKKEYAWCESEMKKASREMGFGDDWKKALEAVKNDHAKPGEQPKVIQDLAEEAIAYVEGHDLVTVPDLAKESWRMEMMSRERQKVSPFFLGGESILVSYPTSEMDHLEKQMSLKANNVHFARATVHHELIPGHHLQQFYESRFNTQRGMFSTPFWVEGYALYYELLFWEMGFPKTPQNKIGMLFWRMHRTARIIFSLSFHLKKMTGQECVDFLVDKVGHERASAEGEVRRSLSGGYPPLYQIAYLVGALQLWELRHELVDSKKMTNREFHDRIFKENAIPIELLRSTLSSKPLTQDFKTSWRFYKL